MEDGRAARFSIYLSISIPRCLGTRRAPRSRPALGNVECHRGGKGTCTCNPKQTKTYASFNVREAERAEKRALKAAAAAKKKAAAAGH